IKQIFRLTKKVNYTFFDIKEFKTDTIIHWCFGKELTDVMLYILVLMVIAETILSRLLKRIM
ncbi:MAG: hypothetical protein NZ839_05040, partial [Endomicrobia bacterium]|nr:hypothetical protein [Endomicrobiia bacterium]